MRSMAHPEYERTAWTPERRKAASERAKAMWRAKRAAAEKRRAQRTNSPLGKANEEIARIVTRQNEIADEWHRLNSRKDNLIKARDKMKDAFDILEKEGFDKWLTWLND